MARKQLRVAGPDDKPQKRQSVAEAAESGDHRALLVAMRERIAKAVSNAECPPRDLAALTRRLQDIAKEIEALDAEADREDAENADHPDEAFDSEAL